MKLPDDWKTQDKSLYIDKYNILILGDIHFGKYKNIKNDYMDIHQRINKLINEFQPNKLIFNGDTWNGFPYDNQSINILQNINTSVNEIILIEGNHEEKCGGFSEEIKQEFTTTQQYKINNILIHHGHHTPYAKVEHHIIGHIHPKYKKDIIYLHHKNAYYGASVTILPAFNDNIEGHDIRSSDYAGFCPILSDGIDITKYDRRETQY